MICLGNDRGKTLKIEAVFCDLHPKKKLVEASFQIASRRTYSDEKALRCTHAGCTRYYHYDFGYFPFTPGGEPEFGNLAAKPSCRIKHDLLYMLLTKINGELVYACFHPDCTSTLPYSLSKKGA